MGTTRRALGTYGTVGGLTTIFLNSITFISVALNVLELLI